MTVNDHVDYMLPHEIAKMCDETQAAINTLASYDLHATLPEPRRLESVERNATSLMRRAVRMRLLAQSLRKRITAERARRAADERRAMRDLERAAGR